MEKGKKKKKLLQGDDQLQEKAAKTLPGYYVRGLLNEDGTCFLNALVQILFSSDLLRKYFLESVDDSSGPLHSSLRNLFLQTVQTVGPGNRINTDAIDPTPFFKALCDRFPKAYAPDGGGSSKLLIRDLINGLSSEECSRSECVTTDVDTMFRVKSNVICSECSHSEPVTRFGLKLDVPYLPNPNDRWIERPKTKIKNHSRKFSHEEHMSAILNLFECTRITAKSAKTSRDLYTISRCIGCCKYDSKDLLSGRRRENITENQLLITEAPQILVIFLKYVSFDFDKLLFNGRRVEYREILDLKPYMDPKCIDRDDAYKYRLIGLVEETIMNDGGHAFAIVRGTNADGIWSWYAVDDESIIANLSVEKVLGRKPYMLFYERC